MKKKILIVEDEKDLSEMMTSALEGPDFDITISDDGNKALTLIQKEDSYFDIFILDRMLPSISGMDICKFLRLFSPTKNHPILMVTALSDPKQIIEGLDAGADDYITKPFDINILIARVKALMRRSEFISEEKISTEEHIYKIKGLTIDTQQFKVWINNIEVELTLSEFKLLSAFLKSPGKVLTRNQLIKSIQDGPVVVTDRTIDTHIFGLRKKLKEYSSLIETIRGIGYRVTSER
jgi:two-component system, OmpR family, phosphate regulon response regulator PhoB